MKKKITVTLLGAMLALSMVGCGNKNAGTADNIDTVDKVENVIKDNTITISDVAVDFDQLTEDLFNAEDKAAYDDVAHKVILEVGRKGVALTCAPTTMYQPYDKIFYEDNGLVVDDNISPMMISTLHGTEFRISQIVSGTDSSKLPCDMIAPNGISVLEDVEKLTDNPSCFEMLSPYAHGDIYKTQKDISTGFGKSYVCIYLDGKLVDISAYEDEFNAENERKSGEYQYTYYKDMVRSISFLNFYNADAYARYEMLPGDDVPASKQLLKNDVMAGIALDDCLSKIVSGTNQKLMIVRIFENKFPSSPDSYKGNTMSCVIIQKDK